MGGNGTLSKGQEMSEESRQWKTVDTIPARGGFPEVAIVEMKNLKYIKTPEESHKPNRAYAVFYPNGSDVKEIALYKNHKKTYVVSTESHHGIQPHYHKWDDGKQEKEGHPLSEEMEKLLEHVRKYKK